MQFLLVLLRFWLLLALVLFSGVVAIYNQEIVSISLPPLIQHISIPAYQAFSGFLFIGATLTLIFFGLENLKKSFRIRKLEKRCYELEGKKHSPAVSIQPSKTIAETEGI